MSILKIAIYPDPILKERASEVTEFNSELHTLLDNMAETMYDADGIGLAAPQISKLARIAVIDVSRDGDTLIELINPEIVEASGNTSSEEGCLSIPEYREKVERHEVVKVRAQDRNGETFELDADGILSICLQHELDHLDGVLFIDRLSYLKKQIFKKWYRKVGPLE